MKTSVLARTTISFCLLAAAVETILASTSTAKLSAGDALIMLFVVGPYVLLALFAWRQRGRAKASWALLAVAAPISVWGIYEFGVDSYRYHTDPEYRMVQRLTAFIVPVVQWAVVLLVSLGWLLWRLVRR